MANKAFLQLADKARFTINTFIPNPLLKRNEQIYKYNLIKATDFIELRLLKLKVKGYTRQRIKYLLSQEYKHLK